MLPGGHSCHLSNRFMNLFVHCFTTHEYLLDLIMFNEGGEECQLKIRLILEMHNDLGMPRSMEGEIFQFVPDQSLLVLLV